MELPELFSRERFPIRLSGGDFLREVPYEILLTQTLARTYPNQIGINPLPMSWGQKDPEQRGPVVVSRTATTLGRRNGMSQHDFWPGIHADAAVL